MVGRRSWFRPREQPVTAFRAVRRSPFKQWEAWGLSRHLPFDGAVNKLSSPLLAPPLPLLGRQPRPTLKSLLVFLLRDPTSTPSSYLHGALPPLLLQGDLRCSLVLLVPGPSESHVQDREARRRVTFVGIFNLGKNKQIAPELNVKGKLPERAAWEGGGPSPQGDSLLCVP